MKDPDGENEEIESRQFLADAASRPNTEDHHVLILYVFPVGIEKSGEKKKRVMTDCEFRGVYIGESEKNFTSPIFLPFYS